MTMHDLQTSRGTEKRLPFWGHIAVYDAFKNSVVLLLINSELFLALLVDKQAEHED